MGFKASEMPEGGGFLDDADVTLVSHKFVKFDYDGTVDPAVTALRVEILPDGAEEPVIQFYSAGACEPSEDGKEPGEEGCFIVTAEGEAYNLRKSSNAGLYIFALQEAGFPEENVEDDVSVFDGTRAHVAQRPAPVRKGLTQREGKTILLPTQVLEEEAPKGKAKGKTAAKGKDKGPSTEDRTDEFVSGILGTAAYKKKGIERAKLAQEAFKAFKGQPDLKKIVALINDDDYIGGDDRPWNYDADEEKLTAA